MIRTNKLGVSLLELMVALSIIMIIFSCVGGLYLNMHKNEHSQLALLQMTENANTAIRLLKHEIQQAGWIGCARLQENFPIYSSTSIAFHEQNQLIGGVNSITVRYAQPLELDIINVAPAVGKIIIDGSRLLHPGETLLLSDCKHAELFRIKQVNQLHGLQVILAESPFHFSFTNEAVLHRIVANRLFVAVTQDKHLDGSPIFALYVEGISGQKTRLVEDVNTLRFNYYLRGDSNEEIIQVTDIQNSDNLLAVEMVLTMHSMPHHLWTSFVALH